MNQVEGREVGTGNRELVHRYYDELVNQGRLGVADEIIAEGCVYGPRSELRDQHTGPDGVRQIVTMYRTAFPDLFVMIGGSEVEADRITVHWTAQGFHRGMLRGIAPTGTSVRIVGQDTFSFQGGRIARIQSKQDDKGLLKQIRPVPVSKSGGGAPWGVGLMFGANRGAVLAMVLLGGAVVGALRSQYVISRIQGSFQSDALCQRAMEQRDRADTLLFDLPDDSSSMTKEQRQQKKKAREMADDADHDIERYCNS